jgi:hypothetical protein
MCSEGRPVVQYVYVCVEQGSERSVPLYSSTRPSSRAAATLLGGNQFHGTGWLTPNVVFSWP